MPLYQLDLPIRRARTAAVLLPAAAIFLHGSPVQAADTTPTDSATTLQEVVVTANKREENIEKIGIAASAIGQYGLQALGNQDISQIARFTPSVEVQQFAPTVTIFNIRGVSQNDFSDNEEAPIAFYDDGAYVSALGAIDGRTFDLERIEVLRGPQGTLFGRNATGGVIQAISAPPTSTPEGYITATASSYNQYSSEGAISGPLTDWLRARLSFTTGDGGAYMENTAGPDLGSEKFYGGRLQFAADTGGGGQLKLKFLIMRNAHDREAGTYTFAAAVPNNLGLGTIFGPNQNPFGTCGGCDALGYSSPTTNPFIAHFNGPDLFSRTVLGTTATYTQPLSDSLTLTSITDYQRMQKSYVDDEDMSPVNGFQYYTDQHFFQGSEELRLAYAAGRLKWQVGLFGLKIRSGVGYIADFSDSLGLLANYLSILNTESSAAFGQIEYALNDHFSVITGYRYSYDWKALEYDNTLNGEQAFVFNQTLYPNLAEQQYGNSSGKLELDYKPTANGLYYISVNRGTKSGGFGTPAFAPFDPQLMPFNQEVLTDYEGGLKLTMLNDTAQFNAGVFHYDYEHYQAFETVGINLTVRNLDARDDGVELQFTARPLPSLYLQTYATFLNTEVFNVSLPSGAIMNRTMPQAPRVSLGTLAHYSFTVAGGDLAMQADWKFSSGQYFDVFNAPSNHEGSYATGDVRLTYSRFQSPYEFAFFVNNVTNRLYFVYRYDFSAYLGSEELVYQRPRWFGGSVTYRFGE
jgi:iron complex outermembrane recepter protein